MVEEENYSDLFVQQEVTDNSASSDESGSESSSDSSSGSSSYSSGKPSSKSGKTKRSSESTTDNATDNSSDNSNEDNSTESNSDNTTIAGTQLGTYSSDNIQITLTQYRENNTDIYVADIQVVSVEYLRTAFANQTYGKNVTEKTSTIANENEAILAINGDFYGARNRGYVIRNHQIYRESSAGNSQEDLVIYTDGSFEIISEGDVTAQELLEQGAWQVLSFGPGLINQGEVMVTSDSEVDRAMTSNPRTAIGEIDELHYVMIVSDGRTNQSEGLNLLELAKFMQSLGVTTAYNLDGGGSSTMYYNGEVINQPTTNGRKIAERSVSDIVYLGE